MSLSKKPGALLKRIVTDAAITLLTDAAVLAAFFVFYRILFQQYGAENLGLYALMRRYAAMLLPVVVLGLSDGLGRYIAQSTTPFARMKLVAMGGLGVIIANGIAWICLNADADLSASWLFGDSGFRAAVLPFSVLVIGLSMHLFVYSCLRGHLWVLTLNLMQFVNLGLVPIGALLLFAEADFGDVVVVIGIASTVVSILFLAALVRAPKTASWSAGDRPPIALLYAFSVSRIPGALIGAALASAAPIIAKDHVSMIDVGYLSLALALLIAVGGAVSPLGTVLLPHISALRDDTQAVGRRLHLLIGATVQIYLFAAFQFLALGDFLIEFWMGTAFVPATAVTTIVLASLPFYGFYCATRSVLDAISTRPINSLNTAISLLVLLGLLLLTLQLPTAPNLIEFFGAACSVAVVVLGTLTYLALRGIVPQQRHQDVRHVLWGLGLSGGFYLASIAAKPVITSSLPLFGAYVLGVSALYLWMLHSFKFEWPGIIFGKSVS
jgi:O-antigen/teichoic acid export membrane protein